MEPGKLSGREILAGFSGVFFVVALFLLGVQFNLVKYENTLRILTPAFIGVFGTTFALEQLRINRRKSNMDLFDKRFGIYLEFIKVIREIRSFELLPPKDPKIEPYTEENKDKMKEKEKENFKHIDNIILKLDDNIELSKVILPDITDKLRETKTILNDQNHYRNLLQQDRIDQKNTKIETFDSFMNSSKRFIDLEKNFHLIFKNYFKV